MKILVGVYSKEEPEKVERDSNGTLIQPGLRVAYNYSGNVELGYIVSLEKNMWYKNKPFENTWWKLWFKLSVRNAETGKISTIKNPNSFIIV